MGADIHTYTLTQHLPLYALDKLFKYTHTHTHVQTFHFSSFAITAKDCQSFILLAFKLDLSLIYALSSALNSAANLVFFSLDRVVMV